MADESHFYFTMRRLNLGAGNWSSLNDLVDEIQMNGIRAEHRLAKRTNLAGTAINREGLYPNSAVEFDKFAQKLAVEFGVPVEDITINESAETYGIKATYVYLAQDRFTIQLHGWLADDIPGTLQDSRDDARLMISSEIAAWE